MEYGEFVDDVSFGDFEGEEKPIEELLRDPLLPIFNRGTWVRVAARDGRWVGKHMEVAAEKHHFYRPQASKNYICKASTQKH